MTVSSKCLQAPYAISLHAGIVKYNTGVELVIPFAI
jgi:hypothetical protein